MKLLLATSSFKTGYGGIASYAHDFINALGEIFDITVLTGDYEMTIPNKCKDVQHYNFSKICKSNAVNLYNLINSIKPDIIINSNVTLISIISRFLDNNIKIISISHFVNGPLAWSAGINAHYIDNIIVLSSYGKDYIDKKYHIKDSKTKIVLNYVENKCIINDNKTEREVLNIVYPGGCSYKKSAEIVCHAILKLLQTDLNFHLYWLGKTKIAGENIPIIQIKDISDILPTNDNRIKHIGQIERSSAKEIIGNANIFLLPSRGEGFPISLAEAMSNSCIPIISDAKHGSLDIIKNNINGLIIKQGNIKELFNIIVKILSNHNNYSSIYENSRKTYNKLLSKEVWTKNMIKILNNNNCHRNRYTNFCTLSFYSILIKYKKDMLIYFFKDRVQQLYHFLYFKYLFVKFRHNK